MRRTNILLGAVLGLAAATAAQAAEMYPWRQHRAPYDFLFGNDIDTHQQTSLGQDGKLTGYFYIEYTGVVTKDNYRVATHVNCDSVTDCSVGWTINAQPSSAKLVGQPMNDHPVFWLPRADIPQPGSYAHFHWIGMAMPMPYVSADGYLLQLTAVNSFCFIHHGAEAATSAATCRDNGGVNVDRGVDISTHLNIVPDDPAAM
jgi:hypothetical protein